MPPTGPNPYLKTKILTATPEELRLMLYEGAIRFAQQARTAIQEKNWESSYNALMRAQKIVLELSTSLNHQADPVLCDKLSALYTYIYKLLVDANIEHQTKPVDEALRLLEYEKETWQLLMAKLAEQGIGRNTLNGAQTQQTAMSSLPK